MLANTGWPSWALFPREHDVEAATDGFEPSTRASQLWRDAGTPTTKACVQVIQSAISAGIGGVSAAQRCMIQAESDLAIEHGRQTCEITAISAGHKALRAPFAGAQPLA